MNLFSLTLILCLSGCGSNNNEPVNAQTDNFKYRNFTEVKDTMLLNPGVGLYRWNGNEVAPFPSMDRYSRCNWNVLELAQGVYDFSSLKNEAAAAASDPDGKGTYGFAFRCMVQNVDHAYPAYLDSKMTSWYSNNKKCWVPDWNNPYFLERHDSLVANLGRTFNNDPRIGYVEIRTYGNWGEGHMAGFEAPPAPLTTITAETFKHIIDVFVKAFPDKQLIVMSDDPTQLDYAMTISEKGMKYPIGWRRDSWSNPQMNSLLNSTAWGKTINRWKKAPVIIEPYGNSQNTYTECPNQTLQYHISAISNGNIDAWSSMTSVQQSSFLQSVKMSGYHYVLRSFGYADSLIAGKSNTVKTIWSNVGVAPAYRLWNVKYRLCDTSTGSIVWETVSSLDLRTFLPTYNFTTIIDSPQTVQDTFTLPSSVAAGNYNLEMIVVDALNYYNPLKIAISGRRSDGSYPLGTIRVVTK